MKQTFVIGNPLSRRRIIERIEVMPVGTRVELTDEIRTIEQNKKMWAMLGELSEQVVWYGRKLEPVDWKDVFTASLRRSRVVPGIDRGTFVALGMHTSVMSKYEFSELIELIFAFAAEHDVQFSKETMDA